VTFLPASSPAGQARGPLLRSPGALAVDNRGTGARLASFALAGGDIERMMEALQRAVPIPQREVVMRRALRRQVLRHSLPLTAGREHVEDRVQDLADVRIARSPAALGRPDHRLDQRPFGIAQVAWIPQPTVIGRGTVFRLPHRAPLSIDSGASQRIITDSSDSTTFWIGSKIDFPAKVRRPAPARSN
jgi:hypothetical protein